MKTIIQYQIEIAICMAAFALLYLLLWRKETNFQLKRLLLVGIPLLSIIIPLININIDLNTGQESATLQYITYLPSQVEMVYYPVIAEAEAMSHWEMAFWILVAGSLIMLIRLFVSYWRIIRIYRRSVADPSGRFRIADDPIQSFSFFKMIMINRLQAQSNERDYIIAHEKAHTRQGHSWDILWLELIKMLHWFNPVIWLLTQESKKNLEYLADKEVSVTTRDLQNYQFAIVQHASQSGYQLLKTQFSKNNLKNRIMMMNQANNQKVAIWKALMILPALALLLMSFSIKIETLDIPNKVKQTIAHIESSLPESEKVESISNTLTSERRREQSNLQTTSPEEQMRTNGPIETVASDLKGNNNPMIQTEQDSGQRSNGNAFRIQQLNADLWEQNAYNSALASGKAKVINPPPYRISSGIKMARAYEYPVENQISGTITDKSGEPIPGANILIKGYTIGTITDVSGRFLLKFEPEHKQIVISKVGYEIKTLDLISGKEYQITLERDADAPALSEKDNHENGGVSIRVNDDDQLKSVKKPLIIVDGKEIDNFDLNSINPQDIESISVLKDASTFKLYGEKAKDGVIIIRSKDSSQNDDSFKTNKPGDRAENSFHTKISKSIDKENPPLVILDGKETSYSKIEQLKPEKIDYIEVLKDELAIREYGEKGKNGVIIVQSKTRRQNTNGYLKNEPGGAVENQKGSVTAAEESMTAFYKSIQKQIKYPLEARQGGIQGKVYVSFDVADDGKIRNVEATDTRYTLLEEIVVVGYTAQGNNEKPADNDLSILEEEVVRVIKLIDEIEPLIRDGKPTATRMTLPVTFKLD